MIERHRFKLYWTEPAVDDLKDVAAFIRLRSPECSPELVHQWKKRIQTLSSHPDRGRPVPETMAIGVDNYRELLLNPYRVIYRIKGERVFIMGFLDGRRDLEDLLLERLSR